MTIFPLRRRDAALLQLKVPEMPFVPVDGEDNAGEQSLPEPEEPTDVSPANELATALVALDIAEALHAEHEPEAVAEAPAPLSQRHLETIDRMVDHLRAGEKRLERQILEAKRQLADTRLARHGYERNSTELRRGIAILVQADAQPSVAPRPRLAKAAPPDVNRTPEPVADVDEVDEVPVVKVRAARNVH